MVTTRPLLDPGGVSPMTGGFPHLSPTSRPGSPGTGGGVSPPPLGHRGKPRPVTPCQRALGGPHRGAIRRGTDGFTEPRKPRVSPIRRSQAAVTGGFGSPGGTLVVSRGDDTVRRDRVLPASRVVRAPHPGVGRPYLPRVPACRGGMASFAAPDAPAAMAVDREAKGAGALLGAEEDIDDDALANLLSAS